MPVSYYFDYYSIVISLKSGRVMLPALFFFLRITLAIAFGYFANDAEHLFNMLYSIFKSRDITLPTKVHLVKAMVFPVVMYGCESWTVEKAER